MNYTISNKEPLNWGAKGHDRILQNISNILSTFKYEVAYDRTFGRDPQNIDKPLNKSLSAIITETYDLIKKHEPRVTVKDVEVDSIDGDIIIKVVVEIE